MRNVLRFLTPRSFLILVVMIFATGVLIARHSIAIGKSPAFPLSLEAPEVPPPDDDDEEEEDFDEEDEEDFDEEEDEAPEGELAEERHEIRERLQEVQAELRELEADDSPQRVMLQNDREFLKYDLETLTKIEQLIERRDEAEEEDEFDIAERFEEALEQLFESREQKRELHELRQGLLRLDQYAAEAAHDPQRQIHLPLIKKAQKSHRKLLKVGQQMERTLATLGATRAELAELEETYEELGAEVEGQSIRLEYLMEREGDDGLEDDDNPQAGLGDEVLDITSSLDRAPVFSLAQTKASLTEYCFDCHSGDSPEANLNLEVLLTETPLVRNRDDWRRTMQVIELKAMPPEDMTQPSVEERLGIMAYFYRAIEEYDYSQIDDPGDESARRLTHEQYNNTIRDLLGVDLRPAERFPSELSGASGFDNSANTLFLQPSLMERYIGAAERVIAIALPPQPKTDVERSTRELIFVAAPGEGLSAEDAARQVFERFLRRAYRRPATDAPDLIRGLLRRPPGAAPARGASAS
ncbi:MAG: DUF1587 domain-containing protein, partial [Planctomycetota bacterium]